MLVILLLGCVRARDYVEVVVGFVGGIWILWPGFLPMKNYFRVYAKSHFVR